MIIEEEIVRAKPKYDNSCKPYELLCKRYSFKKYTRKLNNEPVWRHCKYYQTEHGAIDGLTAHRNNNYDKAYYDYPGTSLESVYPHITPTITICRYKLVKRRTKKCDA